MLTMPVWFEITTAVLSVLINAAMVVIAVVSAYYAYKAYLHQKERSKKEAACKLAKYYASDIIRKYSRISNVFNESGLFDEIKSIVSLKALKSFDREEMEALLAAHQIKIEEFEKKMTDIDPFVILQSQLADAHSVMERSIIMEGFIKTNEEGKREIINASFLQNDFMQDIGDLLNNLEWFAMNCQYGLADEEILYQSLHQTYLSTIWMLCFYISSRNTSNEDKLFTNVIGLFVAWRDRLSEITDKSKAEQEELLRKANAAKPKVFTGSPLK